MISPQVTFLLTEDPSYAPERRGRRRRRREPLPLDRFFLYSSLSSVSGGLTIFTTNSDIHDVSTIVEDNTAIDKVLTPRSLNCGRYSTHWTKLNQILVPIVWKWFSTTQSKTAKELEQRNTKTETLFYQVKYFLQLYRCILQSTVGFWETFFFFALQSFWPPFQIRIITLLELCLYPPDEFKWGCHAHFCSDFSVSYSLQELSVLSTAKRSIL